MRSGEKGRYNTGITVACLSCGFDANVEGSYFFVTQSFHLYRCSLRIPTEAPARGSWVSERYHSGVPWGENIPHRGPIPGEFPRLARSSGAGLVDLTLPAAVSTIDVKRARLLFQLKGIIRLFIGNRLRRFGWLCI